MRGKGELIMCCCAIAVLPMCGGIGAASPEDSASVRAMFAQPPREYSSAPLWVWNDMITEEEVVSTLHDLAGQGVRQAFVHPRPGLMTPYLSEDWFRLWKVALAEANKLDMNIWIYDENSYPSGFAGGFVPEMMPESQGLGLAMRSAKRPGTADDATVGVFRREGDGYKDITAQVRAGKDMPEAEYLVATIQRAKTSPWFAGKYYVDLLRPGVTQKFIEITLGAYEREIGDEFRKHMPGSFTDEPHLAPAEGLHWTGDLPDVFQKRWGYSLLENLPSLSEETGDWKRVRHDYYQVMLDLFIDRWAKPYFEYCRERGIEFTGHYWEHEWPNTRTSPDNMAMSAWQQRPGIDVLFNQYSENCRAQFGNVRSVMELASAANQLGLKRKLCETYGGGGWDMRFEDMKRIGDWVSVLGVDMIDQHLSHMTLRGARKRDYPPSFSYHASWWDSYHVIASYFTRLALALSSGEQVNRILILEPTTTAWMYQDAGGEHLNKIGETFQQLVTACAKAQIEFDLGSEDIIARQGSVDGTDFVVGKCRYNTVVIPPLTENLNTKTWELLEAYLRADGIVIDCGEAPPSMSDAQASERGGSAARLSGWKRVAVDRLVAAVREQPSDGFKIDRTENDGGILYHQRRRLSDGDLLFLVNTSIDAAASGYVSSAAKSVQKWDLDKGTIEPYPWTEAAQGSKTQFSLPPCGSLLLFLSGNAGEKPAESPEKSPTVMAAQSIRIGRADPNVLTLDFMDVKVGDETREAVLFKRAAEFAFRKNGVDNDPWDHAVQFRDELIRKTFPPKSGLEATYRFTIEDRVPEALCIVIERPDIYTIKCNGKRIHWDGKSWWLDRAFGKIDIRAAAVVGENKVTIKASPFTMFHELEPAYVLGDFALKPTEKGFAIVPPRELKLGPWNEQGLSLYGAGVTYTSEFDLSPTPGRYTISLPEWYGSVAKVTVNGKPAGHIYCKPAECDITEHVAAGKNTVEVAVVGTLKNTLGPHHGNPPLGIASPGSFHKVNDPGPPPGSEYSAIGYGLFAPFELRYVPRS